MNPEIISSRFVPHPRDFVFAAFTSPELLAEWWGPQGFTNHFEKFELRKGGAWLFTMRAPDGSEHRMVKEFVEIIPLQQIVVQHMEPLEHRFRMTMGFADEDGGTRLTWRMAFESQAEDARVRPFVVDANEQNFDRLAELLATRSNS
jgi:uncharacterized protein YndB with AHSA1/START domain